MNQIKNINLRNLMKEWTDPDIAQYYLACCLGLMVYDDELAHFREAKHIFWTGNQISQMLDEILEKLTQNNIVEFNEENSKYRWKELTK